MIQQLLEQLIADVTRVAEAGAAVAPHDERLRQHAQQLHALAAHVPPLERLAAALDRLAAGTPQTAAAALLDLLVLSRQVCAAVAGVASVEGALDPPQRQKTRLCNAVPVISLLPVLDGFYARLTSHLTPELKADCRYQLARESKALRPSD